MNFVISSLVFVALAPGLVPILAGEVDRTEILIETPEKAV
jgi:hypothetical protein